MIKVLIISLFDDSGSKFGIRNGGYILGRIVDPYQFYISAPCVALACYDVDVLMPVGKIDLRITPGSTNPDSSVHVHFAVGRAIHPTVKLISVVPRALAANPNPTEYAPLAG